MHLRLYGLFLFSFHDFEALDLRDKLYALHPSAIEFQSNAASVPLGMAERDQLAPYYGKPVSQVFAKFTCWCLNSSGLEVLHLVFGQDSI
jgi:hypothetical protein